MSLPWVSNVGSIFISSVAVVSAFLVFVVVLTRDLLVFVSVFIVSVFVTSAFVVTGVVLSVVVLAVVLAVETVCAGGIV